MQVHKPAKYIKEEIKRVLFVGAGDAGLLNEIVKYPSLELVVGLELDQHVTRMAYKHFGAKPHYDDARVQWWYGDASKTLLMLPAEYFGTFDMVLVDLSDTIFALSVSGELDVIGALSLLLRPGGIFAMNELYVLLLFPLDLFSPTHSRMRLLVSLQGSVIYFSILFIINFMMYRRSQIKRLSLPAMMLTL